MSSQRYSAGLAPNVRVWNWQLAVNQISVALLEPIHGECRVGAAAQALESGAHPLAHRHAGQDMVGEFQCKSIFT